jgi:arylsulfatase
VSGDRPPIVLILMDQLRADAIGAAGNPFVQTPNLDRIAAQSVRFAQCITSAPLCRPARITLITGLPVWHHEFDTNTRVPDPASVPSHVRRLRDQAGYHTAVVGKTHLHGGVGHLDDHRGILDRWGFADAVELPDAMDVRLRSAHSDALGADGYRRWRDRTAHHPLIGPPPDAAPWHLGTEDHLDSFCARVAADRIRALPDDRPAYLQVCFPGPHPPFDATSEFLAALDPADPGLPRPISRGGTGPVSPVAHRYRRRQRPWSDEELLQLRVAYFAKVALVDRAVGRVWAALAEAGLTERAWILVTSDHGELLGDHGLVGKVLCYESAVRVPLLVRPPGGLVGRVDPGPVDTIDVARTVEQIAGLRPDGLARRVLEGPDGAGEHRSIVFENLGTVGLRHPRWTMAWDRRLGRPVELYDRVDDPQQRHNRVDDPSARTACGALVEELRRQDAL